MTKPLLVLIPIIIFVSIMVLITPSKAEPLKPGNHYFTANWCSACQSQGIDIQKLQDEGYDIEIYNQEEVPEIFKNLNIKALPYFIIIKVDGTITRLKGKQPIKKLVKVLVKERKIDIKIGNIEIKVN